MRKILACGVSVCVLLAGAAPLRAQGILGKLKQKVQDKANQHVDNSTTTAVDKADSAATGAAKAAVDPNAPAAAAAPAAAGTPAAGPAAAPAGANVPASATAVGAGAPAVATIATYQNYDFVPGDTILFADDFTTTQDGEFPDQWELVKGQAVVNKQAGYPAFLLTDGNYATVNPRIKTASYLGPQFTIEYDTYATQGSYQLLVFFRNGAETVGTLSTNKSESEFTGDGVQLAGNLPAAIEGEKYVNGWRHIAIAVKGHQMKVYVDQYRVLTVPDMKAVPTSVELGGIGDQTNPIVFRNFRIANGGGMNMLGQKFTDAKIVTHGINFDVDQATIRPESMGTLNQIKRILTDNPELKFEIDGHTDSSGVAAHNATLSQQRADAVKAQLEAMGIDGTRLTTKGFGDTKPIADNGTPDGKANNRRVEFVKVS